MKKAIVIILLATLAVTACGRTDASPIGVQQTEVADEVSIKLVSEDDGAFNFYLGAKSNFNVAVKNIGTEPCHVFIKMTMPAAEGADVYDYQISDAWDEIEPEVFYGGILEPGQTTTELLKEIRVHDYGEVSQERLEAIGDAARGFRVQGRAIMPMEHGTPEQLWKMIRN